MWRLKPKLSSGRPVTTGQRDTGGTKTTVSPQRRSVHSVFRGAQLDRGHGTGAWSCTLIAMTTMAWNQSAFVPEDHEAAKREALVRRLESALAAPDGQHSAKYRGTADLRRNGFSAVR